MQNVFAKYKDHVIDEKTQKVLNAPLADSTGFNEGHEEFLRMLISKLTVGEINPHSPQSIYNRKVYDTLSEADQEAADLTAVNLISLIRQIEGLWKIDQKATFQIQNLVETVFLMKSRFESKYGDVYVI